MRRQLRMLQREMMGGSTSAAGGSISLSSARAVVLWGFWRERQHVPMPFGGAPFSTGRPFLLSVHVLHERDFRGEMSAASRSTWAAFQSYCIIGRN